MKSKIKLVLVAVSVCLLVSLAANGYLYLYVNNGSQQQVTDLQSQVVTLQSQIVNLQNQATTLKSQVGNLQNQTNSLQNESSTLQNENANLGSQVANLTDQNGNLQQQINSSQTIISSLQNENVNLQKLLELKNAPNLVTALGITDVRSGPPMIFPHPENNRLYIAGTVYNMGATTASNCRLHVTAYREGQTVIGLYITLGTGTIDAGSSVIVDENIIMQVDPSVTGQ